MNPMKLSAVLAIVVAAGGCVTQGKYDEAVARTRLTQAELDRKSNMLSESKAQLDAQRAEIARLEDQISDLSKSTEVNRSSNEARIAELRKRVDELKASHAAAAMRAALFRELARRLATQVDAGELFILVRDGRMVLQLPDDVLFDTGKTDLKPAGKKALEAIAEVLASMPNRQFQVAGHTDNVPIRNERFASNWELSSGRALRVVHFLMEKGVQPSVLSAAGYGEVDPISDNASPEGRKRNRRTEITLQPNIDELVRVP